MKRIYITFFITLSLLFSNSLTAQDRTKEAKEYFKIFFNTTYDTYTLFAMHQPSLKDCKYMFKEDWGLWMFRSYNLSFCEMANEYASQDRPLDGNIFMDYKAVRVEKFNTTDVINEKCEICPGAITSITSYLKPNIECYNITFLESETDEYGRRFAFFVFIDNRWVLFPIN